VVFVIERWWAPTRATVDPDAVVLALLQPSGHASGDLGATLLAVHRAGAAAIEVVSKGVVPGEGRLIGVMGDTRERVAGMVVDAAAHSMDATYAGLFIRDFYNDAEQSALALFRTAVSKGVSPPFAAARVAAVYGVPTTGMAKYIAMACDPKANPVALSDEADRALLSYVSKVVGQEAKETKELVSKQPRPGTVADRDTQTLAELEWDPAEHPRDDEGRFAFTNAETTLDDPAYRARPALADPAWVAQMRTMMGQGGQAAPQVGIRPTTRKKAEVKRVSRVKRVTRVKHREQVATEAEAGTATAAQIKGKTISARKIGAAPISGKLIRASRISAKINPSTPPTAPPPPAAPPQTARNMRVFQNAMSSDQYQELDRYLNFWMPGKEAFDFQGDSGGTEEARLFRMGHLEGASSGAFDKGTKEAEDRLDVEADLAKSKAYPTNNGRRAQPDEYINPTVGELTDADVYESPEGPENYKDKKRREVALEVSKRSDGNDYEVELNNTYSMQDYADGRELIIHMEEATPNKSGKVKLPIVAEYRLSGSVMGLPEEEGTRSGASTPITLDANATYVTGKDPVILYDQKRGVFVVVYEVTMVSEEEAKQIEGKKGFTKALDLAERTEFNQLHPRGQGGQFRDTDSSTRSLEAETLPVQDWSMAALEREQKRKPKEVKRVQRVKRVKRIQRVQPKTYDTQVGLAPRTISGSKIQSSRISPKVLRAHQITSQKIAERLQPSRPVQMTLDDSKTYRIYNKTNFDALIKRGSFNYVDPDNWEHKPIKLRSNVIQEIKNKTWLGPTETIRNVQDKIEQDSTSHGMDFYFKQTIDTKSAVSEERDMEKLKARVNHLFDTNPDMSYVSIEPVMEQKYDPDTLEATEDWDSLEFPEGAGDLTQTWHVSGSRGKTEPLYVIEMPEYRELPDPDADIIFMGEFNTREVAYHRPGEGESTKINVGSPETMDELGELGMNSAQIRFYQLGFGRALFNPNDQEDPDLPHFGG
jgi:hypothetical protein